MKKDEHMNETLKKGAPEIRSAEIIKNDEQYRRSSYDHLVKVPGAPDLIFLGPDDSFEAPPLGPNEVELELDVALIDNSDVHVRKGEGAHPLAEGKEFIPLHEGAGRIRRIGKKVTRVEIGDYVAIESTNSSKDTKRPSLDDDLQIVGIGTDGLAARRARLPEQVIVKIPEDIEPEIAAQFEPWGVSVHAITRGQRVYQAMTGNDPSEAMHLVNGGTGSIGRLTIATLIADGVSPENILATGTTPEKLEMLAKSFPGVKVINLREQEETRRLLTEVVPKLQKMGGSVPIVIEATGFDPSNILDFVGPNTVFVTVGLSTKIEDENDQKVDNNNMLTRSQRTILTGGRMKERELLEKTRAIHKDTVDETKEPDILRIDSSSDADDHLEKGDRFDIVIDNFGISPSKLHKLSRRGTIWVLGSPVEGNDTLPTKDLLERGATLVGSWARDWEDWDKMTELIQSGKFNLGELPVRLFPFREDTWQLAFDNARAGKTGYDMREK